MSKIILHVGMPKCASSTVQQALSSKEFYEDSNGVSYCALYRSGSFLSGKDVVTRAAKSIFGYAASNLADSLLSLSESSLKKIRHQLSQELEKSTVVLSCEGWGFNALTFRNLSKIFNFSGVEVEVVFFIRPQVDWLNSAWWQWGAFSTNNMESWLNKHFERPDWLGVYNSWKCVDWISDVSVYPVNSRLFYYLGKVLGISSDVLEATKSSNVSSSVELLSFLLNNRELRSGAHDPLFEFVLSRYVNFSGGRAPWVISKDLVEKVINCHAERNRELFESLSSGVKGEFFNEERYFSVSPYNDIRAEKLEDVINYNLDYRDLAVKFAKIIKELEADNRRLRSSLL